ncbi:uncharacterized protein [Gossypium hirsutum]|uniref:Uncharacterized protein n=1 Tax=Gossypium hirsutum TaxID=3635 RepID=A0A1U8JKI0_GOSHI|nr:uncharacterized protein LOC107908013 [Gossypium hirsutum]
MVQLDELDEWRPKTYEKPRTFREITRQFYNVQIKRTSQFKVGDKVLLDNSDPRMLPAKLRSRELNSFVVQNVFPYGTIEATHPEYNTIKVNGHRLKLYFGGNLDNKRVELRIQDLP